MKAAIIAVAAILILVLTGVFIQTVTGRNLRASELEEALNTAIEQTMETAFLKQTYPIQTEEQLIADLTGNLLVQITSDSAVEVRVYNADITRGLLDVEAVETFTYLLGNQGEIRVRKAVILERYQEEEHEETDYEEARDSAALL